MIKKSFHRAAQACLWVLALAGTCYAETPVAVSEYQAKAVYLYNFISFFEWPALSPTRFTIGIIGDDPFGRGFAEVESKPVRATGRTLIIRRFRPREVLSDLHDCDMLFITSSEKNQYKSILEKLGQRPVLTVSESEDFLAQGGMINLVMVKDKLRWEINRNALERAGIKFHPMILQSAVRIVPQAK